MQEGDTIDVASPYGDFTFDESGVSSNAPVVFLSAGVGQTALLSILNHILHSRKTLPRSDWSRPLTYVHVARDERVHAFDAYMREIAGNHQNLLYRVFYTAPKSAILGKDYDFDGRLDLAKVKDALHLSEPAAEYL